MHYILTSFISFVVIVLFSKEIETRVTEQKRTSFGFLHEETELIVNGFNTPVGRPFFVSIYTAFLQTNCGAAIIAPF